MCSAMCATDSRNSASPSAVIDAVASRAAIGSWNCRISTIALNGVSVNCMSRASVLARCLESGAVTTGPPLGPGRNSITPWSSR